LQKVKIRNVKNHPSTRVLSPAASTEGALFFIGQKPIFHLQRGASGLEIGKETSGNDKHTKNTPVPGPRRRNPSSVAKGDKRIGNRDKQK
jgi:hypothetical protein